jgi:hypothetical protein
MTIIAERNSRTRTNKPFYTGIAIILAAIVFLGGNQDSTLKHDRFTRKNGD